MSRHFRETSVRIVFSPSDNVVMCPVDTRRLYGCNTSYQDPDLSAVTEDIEPGIYQIHVGIFSSIQVKFRMIKRNVIRDRRNMCNLSDNKLGTMFEEVNMRFYRVCHV